jgi:F-type H+-transporting ATPase subunit b
MELFTLAAAAEGGPKLFPVPSHILWSIVNFAVLVWLLKKFLYGPLLGAINARENEIETNLKKAAEERAEAERLRADFTAQISNAQRDAQEIITKATKAATATREQIETEARERAAEMLEAATKTIEREKAKALAELREEVAALAIAVAGKVIEKSLTDADHKRLADRFVQEVGKH